MGVRGRGTRIRLPDGLLVPDVSDNDFDALGGPQVVKKCGFRLRGGGRGEDGDAVERVARGEDRGQDVPADVARGAEEEDVARLERHFFSCLYLFIYEQDIYREKEKERIERRGDADISS